MFRPNIGKPKFLPRTARSLGCVPEKHFKLLIEGNTIELEDGTVVRPEMVMSDFVPRSQDTMSIFMPSPDYIPSFLEQNESLLETLRGSIDEDSDDSN